MCSKTILDTSVKLLPPQVLIEVVVSSVTIVYWGIFIVHIRYMGPQWRCWNRAWSEPAWTIGLGLCLTAHTLATIIGRSFRLWTVVNTFKEGLSLGCCCCWWCTAAAAAALLLHCCCCCCCLPSLLTLRSLSLSLSLSL